MPKLSQDRRYTPSVDITEDHDAEGRAAPLAYATELVHRVCCVAASGDYVDELRSEHRELRSAIASRDTPALFNWLMFAFSHQGVSDRVTRQYIDDHGSITWLEIESAIAASPPCPKLDGYWTFHGCGYHKTSRTCAEPEHSSMCPLPGHELRNGRLNQTAHSLYFFMRDVARNDLVGWIDDQLAEVDLGASPSSVVPIGQMRAAILDPLRNVYGVSDKVLCMALSAMFMAAPRSKTLWRQLGASMIAIDTLVHNFLHRTGILDRFGAAHLYGPGCYGAAGCVSVVQTIADRIDARQFNLSFPKSFPRFVQHAIWRYCAENGLNVCNGNRIDDSSRCQNRYCLLYRWCDRKALRQQAKHS